MRINLRGVRAILFFSILCRQDGSASCKNVTCHPRAESSFEMACEPFLNAGDAAKVGHGAAIDAGLAHPQHARQG